MNQPSQEVQKKIVAFFMKHTVPLILADIEKEAKDESKNRAS